MQPSVFARQCFALSTVPGFGLKQFHRMVQGLGHIDSWSTTDKSALHEVCRCHLLAEQIESALKSEEVFPEQLSSWLENARNKLICYFDQDYPDQLRQTHMAPALLYTTGDISLLFKTGIAVVGSRKPSKAYENLAQECAYQLGRQQRVVISGLALGIDTAAHMGALAAKGKTIAVLATGVDRCYPAGNGALFEKIADEGLLVSEMPLGTPPRRGYFPRRNRIVSGLSDGVLVVEAGLKSGSLITARYALEQNRDVYAVPGAPIAKNSAGCNYLIREGASLIDSADTLLETIGLMPAEQLVNPKCNVPVLSQQQVEVVRALGADTLSFDDLFVQLQMEFSDLSATLIELELNGSVVQVAGGYQRVS